MYRGRTTQELIQERTTRDGIKEDAAFLARVVVEKYPHYGQVVAVSELDDAFNTPGDGDEHKEAVVSWLMKHEVCAWGNVSEEDDNAFLVAFETEFRAMQAEYGM